MGFEQLHETERGSFCIKNMNFLHNYLRPLINSVFCLFRFSASVTVESASPGSRSIVALAINIDLG